MNHLIAILAYQPTKSLEYTVKLLKPTHDIVVHVDKKSSLTDFQSIAKDVHFLDERHTVEWGGVTVVLAMLSLIRYAADNHYDYVSIISESDLPLLSGEKMLSFLEENKGKEFIGITSHARNIENNVKYRYFKWMLGKNNLFKKIYAHTFLKKLFKNKYFACLPRLYKGANWFTISSDLCRYILRYIEENPNYCPAFSESINGDELFFQTIVCNSVFAKNIYNLESEYHSSLRYIVWEKGTSPNLLRAEEVMETEWDATYFFARKISSDSDFSLYEKQFTTKRLAE